MGLPGGAEQREGLCGQGDVAVFGTLATVDMDLEALAINVGDVQGQGFREEPQASTIDGGAVDLGMQGGGGREELPDLLHTEDGGETVGGLRTHE